MSPTAQACLEGTGHDMLAAHICRMATTVMADDSGSPRFRLA